MEDIYYQGPKIAFKMRRGSFLVEQVYCDSECNRVFIDGRRAKAFLTKTLFIGNFFAGLAEEEKPRFTEFFYRIAPEYELATATSCFPIAFVVDPDITIFVQETFQDKNGVWTIRWVKTINGVAGETRESPSWDYWRNMLKVVKKETEQARFWDENWEVE